MSESPEWIRARADALYDEREQAEKVRRSVELLERAPHDYEALWRLARAHFFLGQEAHDREQARHHHSAGIKSAALAVRALRTRVEGHFWLGVNLALLARLENPFRALPHALRARASLCRAVNLDPAYHGAGPLRVLARLEANLPRLMGGGRKRACAHFEEAIRLAPRNTVTRLYFAELLLLQPHDYTRASTELEAVLNAPHDPAWAFEIRRDKARAQELLRRCGKG